MRDRGKTIVGQYGQRHARQVAFFTSDAADKCCRWRIAIRAHFLDFDRTQAQRELSSALTAATSRLPTEAPAACGWRFDYLDEASHYIKSAAAIDVCNL